MNLQSIKSPQKRKRTDSNPLETPSKMRLRTDLPTRSVSRTEDEQQSPRTSVSGRMNRLDLNQQQRRTPSFDSHSMRSPISQGSENAAIEPDSHDDMGDNNIVPWKRHHENGLPSQPQDHANTPGAETTAGTPARPATPKLVPVASPAAMTISPLRSAVTSTSPSPGPQAENTPSKRGHTPRSRTPTKPKPSPSKVSRTDRVSKPRRRKSPPPTTVVNDFVWTDAEITGHNPTDPDDDMYGINGVGFRPTREVAEVKSAERRKQIAEWKKREENERRARRIAARNSDSANMGLKEDGSNVDGERKRVRFSQTAPEVQPETEAR